MNTDIVRESLAIRGVELEVFRDRGEDPAVAAAHPSEPFSADTVGLLAGAAERPVAVVNPAGLGGSTGALRPGLEEIVDDLEEARLRLGAAPWLFWGMSGGGWLSLLYAYRHPHALAGIIVESACACLRARAADPACVLSPFFPAWRPALAAAGLLDQNAHAQPLDGAATEWTDVAGAGAVFRRRGGPALLVAPGALGPAMRAMMPAFFGFDARPWLGDLRVPALVIAGTADPVVPLAQARAVHAGMANATFITIDGAGHVPTAERRPEVAAAVRAFLADQSPSRNRAS
jgi:pimeloyl-ACP methyl ester carboxylesterase